MKNIYETIAEEISIQGFKGLANVRNILDVHKNGENPDEKFVDSLSGEKTRFDKEFFKSWLEKTPFNLGSLWIPGSYVTNA